MTTNTVFKSLFGAAVLITLLASSSSAMAFCYYQTRLLNNANKDIEVDWLKYKVRGSSWETILFGGHDFDHGSIYHDSTANLSTECANYDFKFKVRWRCSGGSWQTSESYYKNAEGSFWDGNYTTISGVIYDCDDNGHVYYQHPDWGDGEPNNSSNEDCAVSRSDGQLNDANCNARLPVACKKKIGPYSLWEIISEPHTWAGSFSACKANGWDFVMSASYYDREKLKTEKSNAGVSEVWLNYQDIDQEGSWSEADPPLETLHWSFDSDNNSSARESNGSGLNATLENGALFNTPVAATGASNAKALSFDGTDDYAVISDDDFLDFGKDDDFTVAVWVKAAATQAYTRHSDNDVVEKWTSGSGYPFVIRYINQNHADHGKVHVARYDGSNNPRIMSTVSINDGQFHHIAFIKQGDTLKLFVDGLLNGQTTDTTTGSTANNSPLYLGRRGSSNYANFFKGAIDDLRIYNRAISNSELAALTAAVTPIYQYQEGQSTAFTVNLKSFATGKCITMAAPSFGALAQQWDCNGNGTQWFTFTPVAAKSDVYTVKSVMTHMCLEVVSSSLEKRAQVIQNYCNNGSNQQFAVTSSGDGIYQLTAQHSAQVFTIAGNTDDSGASIVQWTNHGGDNQKWFFISHSVDL